MDIQKVKEENPTLRWFYLRNKHGIPEVCVAADFLPKETGDDVVIPAEETVQQVGISYAKLNDKLDKHAFKKQVGRDIAIGRLWNKRYDKVIEVTPGEKGILEKIVNVILKDGGKASKCSKVRRGAKLFLQQMEKNRLKRLSESQANDYTN